MADLRGLVYAVILGGLVLALAIETFISSMQSTYSANIAPGNQSKNFSYMDTQVKVMNQTVQQMQGGMNDQSGIYSNPFDTLSSAGNAVWATSQLFLNLGFIYVSITADLISALSVAGIPVGWLAFGVLMMVSTNVIIELLSGWQKYRW
ncbi:MAG: hypothetical protein NT130_03455 [Candidatus Micrarchaeota archaeon]|nr:hypothetical protein [Candidatus Micrarchaeota archaeon]